MSNFMVNIKCKLNVSKTFIDSDVVTRYEDIFKIYKIPLVKGISEAEFNIKMRNSIRDAYLLELCEAGYFEQVSFNSVISCTLDYVIIHSVIHVEILSIGEIYDKDN